MEKINPRLIRVDANKLLLDAKNPRLPENIPVNDQKKIWDHMKKSYDLNELALSISNNGYFEAEPLVVIPKDKEFKFGDETQYEEYLSNKENEYIVVEGNRRLATIKGLLKGTLDYGLSDNLKKQFKELPVLFYPNRDDVLAFLGVHHLAGVRKWDVYERARYIAYLKEKKGYSIQDIQNTIGDRKNSARKVYICYRMTKQIEDYDESFGTQDVKKRFSLLLLATGQWSIRKFIGFNTWEDISDQDMVNPIKQDNLENLQFVFQCIFHSNSHKRLIWESRDITGKLKNIFTNSGAIKILKKQKDIDLAYAMSGGELEGILNILDEAQSNLEFANGKLTALEIDEENRNKLKEIIIAIYRTIDDMNKKFVNENQ